MVEVAVLGEGAFRAQSGWKPSESRRGLRVSVRVSHGLEWTLQLCPGGPIWALAVQISGLLCRWLEFEFRDSYQTIPGEGISGSQIFLKPGFRIRRPNGCWI